VLEQDAVEGYGATTSTILTSNSAGDPNGDMETFPSRQFPPVFFPISASLSFRISVDMLTQTWLRVERLVDTTVPEALKTDVCFSLGFFERIFIDVQTEQKIFSPAIWRPSGILKAGIKIVLSIKKLCLN
jgi:hypothetical protein